MESVIVLVAMAAMLGAAAAISPAAAAPRVHHAVKHHRGRHRHGHRRTRHAIRGQPLILVPGAPPAYRYGGPLYSTCDRINADRMLVGTCR